MAYKNCIHEQGCLAKQNFYNKIVDVCICIYIEVMTICFLFFFTQCLMFVKEVK